MIVEIRTYRLKPGTGDEFVRLMRDEAMPLLERFGVRVVACGASLVAEDGQRDAYLEGDLVASGGVRGRAGTVLAEYSRRTTAATPLLPVMPITVLCILLGRHWSSALRRVLSAEALRAALSPPGLWWCGGFGSPHVRGLRRPPPALL